MFEGQGQKGPQLYAEGYLHAERALERYLRGHFIMLDLAQGHLRETWSSPRHRKGINKDENYSPPHHLFLYYVTSVRG